MILAATLYKQNNVSDPNSLASPLISLLSKRDSKTGLTLMVAAISAELPTDYSANRNIFIKLIETPSETLYLIFYYLINFND